MWSIALLPPNFYEYAHLKLKFFPIGRIKRSEEEALDIKKEEDQCKKKVQNLNGKKIKLINEFKVLVEVRKLIDWFRILTLIDWFIIVILIVAALFNPNFRPENFQLFS